MSLVLPMLIESVWHRVFLLPGPFPCKRLGRSGSRELLSFSANMHVCSLGPIPGNFIPALLSSILHLWPSLRSQTCSYRKTSFTLISAHRCDVLKAETRNEPQSYRHQSTQRSERTLHRRRRKTIKHKWHEQMVFLIVPWNANTEYLYRLGSSFGLPQLRSAIGKHLPQEFNSDEQEQKMEGY